MRGLEMFAASLDKSSQLSFEHGKPDNRSLSRLTASYSVRKSVRRIRFLTGAVLEFIWLIARQPNAIFLIAKSESEILK